nr:hypothetical protein [Tanacetum cinerariifolium]
MKCGFLIQKGSGVGRGVKEKQQADSGGYSSGISGALSFGDATNTHAMNFHTLFTPTRKRVDVVVLVEFIRSISLRFVNTSLGKCVAYPVVIYFSSINGLDAMLENGPWFIYNNPVILKKWNSDVNLLREDVGNVPVLIKHHGVPGRSSYARALIEVRANMKLKDNIVVDMPKLVGEGYHMCNVRVEYKWKPPRCACHHGALPYHSTWYTSVNPVRATYPDGDN